jgi:hypothetical protein
MFTFTEGRFTMVTGQFLDGNIADWNASLDDRCLCDVEATIVYRLSMQTKAFETGLSRLGRRRAARAEFVSTKLRGGGGMGVIDAGATFAANDEFEELFGREPLEAFINDTEEVIHRCLGSFFSQAEECNAVTSPMTAGAAFTTGPARSFTTAKDMRQYSEGRLSGWTPSVRTEISFVVGGSVSAINRALACFAPAMADCGVMTRWEQSMRKPDLAGIPHRRPVLAEVLRDGARIIHNM